MAEEEDPAMAAIWLLQPVVWPSLCPSVAEPYIAAVAVALRTKKPKDEQPVWPSLRKSVVEPYIAAVAVALRSVWPTKPRSWKKPEKVEHLRGHQL